MSDTPMLKRAVIQIDKGIPLKPRTFGNANPASTKYPWHGLDVGDSFFVKGKTARTFTSAINYGKKVTGFKFASRAVDGGLRVWRVA